ncbi:uncharacterized protein ASPGLDRAFT_44103 [Aspergillus glaucus CBS 516.65]|uniref:DUF7730 domain-containing protein n=1 Tax=Aspergillus glaucus CBS 516.65 TaxID=1160497 RepID=A0A1L9VR03_ASPGL|nr:hypothetical protein ASPGLDRAFT_44103 [Aspergillus glaucus CBS 516.65]OJJ86324.1 hypothetical protein ASPGLDRAFT_44103 [Aspergillus glaucus CBS 516.65]
MYSEVLPILYGSNVFDVNHIDTFIYLKRSVLSQCLDMIRKVTLTWGLKYYTNYQLHQSPVQYWDVTGGV